MTAEVAVLNKLAVALAADSCAILSEANGKLPSYSAQKLFKLSNDHPAAVMVFGALDHVGIPWEMIVTAYRDQHGGTNKASLEDWGTDFGKFVDQFPNHSEVAAGIGAFLRSYFALIEHKAKDIFHKSQFDEASALTYKEAVITAVAQFAHDVTEKSNFIDEVEADELLLPYSARIEHAADEFVKRVKDVDGLNDAESLEDWDEEDRQLFDVLVAFAYQALRSTARSAEQSGIVIAGFGEKDRYPSCIAYDVDGCVGQKTRIFKRSSLSADSSTALRLQAFGEIQVVDRFVTGFDRSVRFDVREAVRRKIGAVCRCLLAKHGRTESKNNLPVRNKITILSHAVSDRILYDMNTSGYSGELRRRINRSVDFLSKDELAYVAETLVAITALDHLLSDGAGTVGGPIDVAILTRAEGFKWVKCKPTALPSLNTPTPA